MARKEFLTNIAQTLQRVGQDVDSGKSPLYINFRNVQNTPSLVGAGASIMLERNHVLSVTPDTRNFIAQSPEATILIKKKAFSSLSSSNNLSYMDKTEKMLLRATKALFAYKVQQLRAYESLTKFENYYSDNQQYSMNLLSSFLREGQYLKIDNLQYSESEYVSKRLDMWLDETRDMSLKVPGGYSVYDVKTGQFIFLNESQMADVKDDGILNSTADEGVKGSSKTSFPPLTNRDYIKTLSSSVAKMTLDGKRAEFKAEYNKTTTTGTLSSDFGSQNLTGFDLPYSNSMFSGDWLSDIGDAINYSASQAQYDLMMQDIASVIKRNAFSVDNHLTTWIVDPDNVDNYTTGPGTGVIELCAFTGFSTNLGLKSAGASFNLEYPYSLGTVLEEDVDAAIEEALNGTIGILSDLANGGLRTEGMSGSVPPMDAGSIISAALEVGGAGSLDSSLDMEHVRDRMRTFYLGKQIINPPDVVNIFVRSNTSFDNFENKSQSESTIDKSYFEIDEVILKAEYQLYTNQGMSFEQYKKLRSVQDNSFGMVHVFGGYASKISESFSAGYWTMDVTCNSNKDWLSWSQYATQPSLTDPKGMLLDPLTPYNLVTDSVGQVIASEVDLLYENKQLLQTGLLSYDDGILAGQNAKEGNLFQDQFNAFGSLSGKSVMQHPSGFVYRWKTGVISATCGFSVTDPLGENTRNQEIFTQQYSVTVAGGSGPGVLNNLDIANILSVLIVGQPYNIQSFMEQALEAQNISSRTSTTLNSTDPITSVLQTIRRQNETYGNFKPYRMLSVSSATAEQIISQFGMRENASNHVKTLQSRKVALRSRVRDLQKKANNAGASFGGAVPPGSIIATLEAEIQTIDKAIEDQVKIGTRFNGAVSSMDQVGINIDIFGGSSGLPVAGDEDENHDVTRAMMLVGAQRRIEDVRLNRDRNLFIVSDQYDTADIRPFILQLNNSGQWKKFSATYSNVLQTATSAADILKMEFFCNSQGHLEFRPPLWNRTPLTILRESLRLQKETGKRAMPDFITNLFQSRVESLYREVHMLNVRIVLLALMIGRYPDKTLIPNMGVSGDDSLKFFGVKLNTSGGGLFSKSSNPGVKTLSLNQKEFSTSLGSITERNNELFGDGLRLTASFQDNGDILGGDTETLLGTFDVIFQEDMGIANDLLTAAESRSSGGKIRPPASSISTVDNLNAIRDSFKSQFGRDPAQGTGIDAAKGFQFSDLIWSANPDNLDQAITGPNSIFEKIKTTISRRDSYITMLQANLAKQQELEEISSVLSGEIDDPNQEIEAGSGPVQGSAIDFMEKLANATSNAIDIITGKSAEGTVYDHLIQDDTRNLLGYGSGKRLIITDDKLITATISEDPPAFTSVGVKGDAPLGIGSSLNQATDNMYFWAGATDFDMWRQYGYDSTDVETPFLSDVEGQCRPYAMLLLAIEKANVNKASLTVVGNEFYQPGDTVYLQANGMLYYVTTVSHRFTYGSSFETTLKLNYGHPPGHYLPSPLDVIGQDMIGSTSEPPLVYRTGVSTDDQYTPLSPNCCLIFPSGGASAAQLLAYKDNQIRFTNMMMDISGSMIGTRYILIRGFVKDEKDTKAISTVNKKMDTVSSMLQNPTQLAQASTSTGGDDLVEGFGSAITSIKSAFGGSSAGTTRNLKQMKLPNNAPVTPISANRIVRQIVYLKKEDGSNPAGEIQCLNKDLMAAYLLDEQASIFGTPNGIFPKGGPSQETFLDIREDLVSFGNVISGDINAIEVGILNVPSNIVSGS